MLKNILLVGIWSFVGGVLRYLVSLMTKWGSNYLIFSLYVGDSIALGIGATAIGWQLTK